MAPNTPEEWLPTLAARLDHEAIEVGKLRRYVDGNAPLPEGGRRSKPTWIAFQRKALTNYGWIACTSRANRIRYRDVRVGADAQSPVSLAAREIALRNRLQMQISDAIWDMLTARRGYLAAGAGPDGRAVITSEKPELFYAEPDPLYPWRTRAAIKVWRDTIDMIDYALVWVPGLRQRFSRPSFTSQSTRTVRIAAVGGWTAVGDPEPYDGDVPVWILDRRDGKGLIEAHTDMIDRLNTERLQRLSVMAIQAFRQRAIKKDKDAPPLPDRDADGNAYDVASVLEAAPGVFWDLPEGYEIWESSPADIGGLIEAEKHDVREFAAVLGLNISILMPESANQTATGAENARDIEVGDCNGMIERISLAVAACILTGLRIEGIDPNGTIEVDFEPPNAISLGEQFDALSKGQAAGISLETLQKVVLGWSAPMIAEDAANRTRTRALDALTALGSTPQPAGV